MAYRLDVGSVVRLVPSSGKRINKVQHSLNMKVWRDQNKEKMSESGKRRRDDHVDYVKEQIRNYHLLHHKEYLKRYSDIVNARTAKRRATKLQATPDWFEETSVTYLYSKAKELGKIWNCDMHVDHIIPLISNTVCGLHCFDNLQLIEKQLNCSKNNRYQSDW